MHTPETEAQIYDILRHAKAHSESVKVIGANNSPNDIAVTDGHVISLSRFNRIISIDKATHCATVEAGMTLNDLNTRLGEAGLALQNLGSISAQTIGGLISAGSHGTGITHGILATTVKGLEIILADCSKVRCDETQNTALFKAALCAMGALGIIFTVTIQCEPLFCLEAAQYPLPLQTVLNDVEKIINGAEFSRFWWFPHTQHCVVWQANKSASTVVEPPTTRNKLTAIKDKLIGYYALEFLYFLSLQNDHMIPYINRLYRRIQFNKSSAQRDLSYKVFNFDCLFHQYVCEWAIPISKLSVGLQRLQDLIEAKNFKVHLPVEVRFTKGDDIWMSPAYGRDTAWIGVIVYKPYDREAEYQNFFDHFQRIMTELDGRPHWAKLYSNLTPAPQFFEQAYPKYKDFRKLQKEVDPKNIFSNSYLQRIFSDSHDK